MTRYSTVLYTPIISGSGAVAAGEILSINAAIGSTEGGVLDSVQMYNLADVDRGIKVYILGGSGSVGLISGAFSPTDAVAQTFLGWIEFSSGVALDLDNSLFQTKTADSTGQYGIGEYMANLTPSTDASLYAAISVNSTGTYTTGGIALRFNFRHD
jgi:hypothetical protein